MSTHTDQEQAPEAIPAPARPFDGDGASPVVRDALGEIFARLEEASPPSGEEPVSSGSEPVLTVPEELTPLPAVDEAMQTIALFGGAIRGRRARYRIAVLKSLQGDQAWRWRINRMQEIVHWLEPHSVTDIVSELKDVDVLSFDPVTRYYRLGAEGRLVAALLGALTVPQVERRRLIKAINKTMSLSLALGASDDIVLAQFQSAVSQLREDWDELKALLDDFSRDNLLAAAHLVQDHVDDMRELLEEHENFLAARRQEKLYLDVEQEALDLIPQLATLAADVVSALSGRADELMRAGFHVDRGDVRQFIAEVGEKRLADLFADLINPPPFVVSVSADLCYDALEELSGRRRPAPPPLPEPAPLERRVPPERVDAANEIALEAKALSEATPLVDFVVYESWPQSVERHSVLIDAYSRYRAEMPLIEHGEGFDQPARAGVLRISRADLRPREEGADDEDA